jgi:hypothetical protein
VAEALVVCSLLPWQGYKMLCLFSEGWGDFNDYSKCTFFLEDLAL